MPKQSSCTTAVLGGSVVTVSEVQCASSRGGQVVRYYVSFPSVFVSRIVEVRYIYVLLYVRSVAL